MAGDGREGGFIVVHRRVRSSRLYRSLTGEQKAVFYEVLLAANWKDDGVLHAGKWVEIHRGEFAHSLETIAERAGVSVKVVRTAYQKFLADDSCTGGNGPFLVGRWSGTEEGRGIRVLRVVNYDEYQTLNESVGTDLGTPMGTVGARQGHASGTTGAPREPVEPVEQGKPSFALAPDGAPRSEPTRLVRVETDPRFAPLRAAWCEEFAAARGGAEYRWQGAPDAKGIHRVLSVSVDEFRERARRGLNAIGFLRCGTVAKLTSGEVWNQLAGSGPPGPRVVTAAASQRSEFQGGRRHVE